MNYSIFPNHCYFTSKQILSLTLFLIFEGLFKHIPYTDKCLKTSTLDINRTKRYDMCIFLLILIKFTSMRTRATKKWANIVHTVLHIRLKNSDVMQLTKVMMSPARSLAKSGVKKHDKPDKAAPESNIDELLRSWKKKKTGNTYILQVGQNLSYVRKAKPDKDIESQYLNSFLPF